MNIDDLLRIAMERRASDLHLKVGNYPHLRIDGDLTPLTDQPRVSAEDMLTMAFSSGQSATASVPSRIAYGAMLEVPALLYQLDHLLREVARVGRLHCRDGDLFGRIVAQVTPHFVTRQIVIGAGKVGLVDAERA